MSVSSDFAQFLVSVRAFERMTSSAPEMFFYRCEHLVTVRHVLHELPIFHFICVLLANMLFVHLLYHGVCQSYSYL